MINLCGLPAFARPADDDIADRRADRLAGKTGGQTRVWRLWRLT